MKPDLEFSAFQNRAAYRYIREADDLPLPEKIAGERDPIAKIKLFNPTGAGTWYIAAYDPKTRIAFGAAKITDFEYGDIWMPELVDFRGPSGLPLERDLYWKHRRLSECKGT